tara:strand:+ start:1090 stop:1371 length:282 start_codon:yes stop_codon:yes gene_type:complete
MKNFIIQVYDKLVMLLVFVGVIGGVIISYNFASMGYQFSFGIFLLGTVITVVIIALSCGLLLIQLQNNEMLKDIQANTRHNHVLKNIQKNTEK